MDRGGLYLSPCDLNVKEGEIETPLKPMIRFTTPVRQYLIKEDKNKISWS